ncbi:MAG: DUF3943 domain-containing protein [Treponema sp.]|nr:DUF3943 domain-containing protein [Treponema sp.]
MLLLFLQTQLVFSLDDEEQEVETSSKYKPREQKLFIDIPLTIAEVTTGNILGNIYWRLWGPDWEVAYFTADSIRDNMNPRRWTWEEGLGTDTFLVNQFLHPYAGGLYFAAARSNNFNFYWSILASTLGSMSWEIVSETAPPAPNDMITTIASGMVVGEVLHRIFIELDKGGVAKKIGATLVSPADRVTAALRGYGPEDGPNRIRDASLALGFSWVNARFFEDDNNITKKGAGFIDFNLVYDDPFTAHSKIPFDQFDFNVSLAMAVPFLHNFNIITDGYMASWNLVDDEINQVSNGVTLHFDNYITDTGFMDLNNGRENLSFTATSLDYSVKWRHILNKSLEFSLKTHLGFSPWAVTNYNGGINRDDYNFFLLGGNIKLFMELKQIKEKEDDSTTNGHALTLSLCFYDTWTNPNTPGFDSNSLFIFSKLAYSFPLTDRISLYAADSFLFLYCRLTGNPGAEFRDMSRWYNSAQFGLKVSL